MPIWKRGEPQLSATAASDNSTPGGPNADTPVADQGEAQFAELKQSIAELDRAADQLKRVLSGVRAELLAQEQLEDRKLTAARGAVDKAREMKKIASIGVVSKVTLYELQIEYANKRWWLDNLQATVTQAGMKQVVQGWVVKSNQDRRELYLQVPGAFVATFKLQNSAVTPAKLMQFADQINAQASSMSRLRREQQARINLAQFGLVMALGASSPLSQKADALDNVSASEMQQTSSMVATARSLIAQADANDRRVRKPQEQVAKTEAELASVIDTAKREVERIRGRVESADAEARTLIGEVASNGANGHGPQGLDMWLTKIADALQKVGFVETTRWTDHKFGGEQVNASIALAQPTGRVFVLLYASVEEALRACDPGWMLSEGIANAVRQGATALTTRGRVLVMANNPYGMPVDPLEGWANIIAEIEAPSAADEPSTPVEQAPSGAAPAQTQPTQPPDPLEALRKLGELRDAGIITPDDFEAKKTELLKRV